jgi:glycerol kinase
MGNYVGAIDQGTTSTRFIVFNHAGSVVASCQTEHEQILPQPGWVEHDALEIWRNTCSVIEGALEKAGLRADDLDSIGITNQRETTVVWNPKTGQPLYNAVVWQDTRTADLVAQFEAGGQGSIIQKKTGLLVATYFSAVKMRWLFDNVSGLQEAAARGEAVFGTIDSWIIWNLTGGRNGGIFVTDVTNASRTMLMNLGTLDWDEELLSLFAVPREMLPEIRPSSGFFGDTDPRGPFAEKIPVLGTLGDQQAATVGQTCFKPGQAKNTYGTGNFMLLNTADVAVPSQAGLLTTVCYAFGTEKAVYALEGSIAVTGSAVQWLRDQLGLISNAAEIEALANSVEDNGGIYFVPAFSGLFAPYWRPDARGVVVGLSRYANRGHLARSTLEAICYQSRDVLESMEKDAGLDLEIMKVDGGATVNDTLMQLQANILGVTVIRPKVLETTSLGAAYAAGLASGFWQSTDDLIENWAEDRRWEPVWSEDQRESGYQRWKQAVDRTLNWL